MTPAQLDCLSRLVRPLAASPTPLSYEREQSRARHGHGHALWLQGKEHQLRKPDLE
ncbi:hypothetical protein LY78DRAFT_659173 [Colletotrichum sublineola]|nr:hypothetical protein LY78DRAFT_659173 [Colletotrichum sublineola]